MKKNTITPTLSFNNKHQDYSNHDAKFDKLLDEFMSTQVESSFSDNSFNEDDFPEEKNIFTYKGYKYARPDDNQLDYIAGSIKLSLGGSNLHCKNKNEHLLMPYYSVGDGLKLYCDIVDWIENDSTREITMYLYKTGRRYPVSHAQCTSCSAEAFNLTFPLPHNKLKSGEYFIYMPKATACEEEEYSVQKDSLIFPFTVIYDKPGQFIPVVINASAKQHNRSKNNTYPYHSGKLSLETTLKNLPTEQCILSMYCYDENYILMGSGEKFVNPKHCKTRQVQFCIDTYRPWKAQTYTIVLCLNHTPFVTIGMHIDNYGETDCIPKLIDKGSALFWMVKAIEADDSYPQWKSVGSMGGIRKERLHIARLHKEWSRLKQEGTIRQSEVMVFEADSSFHAMRVAMAWKQLLNIGKDSHTYINCAEIGTEGMSNKNDIKDTNNGLFTQLFPSIPGIEKLNGQSRYNGLQVFYKAGHLALPHNSTFMEKLMYRLMNRNENTLYVFCDSSEGLKRLFDAYPAIQSKLHKDYHFVIQPFDAEELTDMVLGKFRDRKIVPTEQEDDHFEYLLREEIQNNLSTYNLAHWDWKEIEKYTDAVAEKAAKRIGHPQKEDEIFIVNEADLVSLKEHLKKHPLKYTTAKAAYSTERKAFDEAMKELNAMVGLNELKEGLSTTLMKVLFNKMRKEQGLPADNEAPHHMLFLGNPGTGKTTVAKMIGKIYHTLGLLSDGEVIATERSELIGPYIGHTEEKMNEVLKKAKGKVLFIDEAYTLCDSTSDRKDFGNHVIESLLTVLAQPNPDIVVILAGYEEEMERLMQQNQGLKSRFAYKYHFDDYNADELFEIGKSELQRYCYELNDEASSLLKQLCQQMTSNKDKTFSNGRWIKQVINNGILPAMARRVMNEPNPNSYDLLTKVVADDVKAAAMQYGPKEKKIQRIGFC